MKYRNLAEKLNVSAIALGCMRMDALSIGEAVEVIRTALANGINFFDHADIYAHGDSETVFAKAFRELGLSRGDIYLESKCGIFVDEGYYDFSKKHILKAVDGSLRRLKTDYLDVLLLHRPDALMEPEEIAEAFDLLEASGKVRFFGVSNQNPMQMELLKTCVKQKLWFNQLQMSLTTCPMIDAGLCVNTGLDAGIVRDGSVLDYCRLKGITVQPWSPFQYGFFEGVFIGSEKYPELNVLLRRYAEEKGVTETAIAIAWLLRHPANMQPVIGTMNCGRIAESCSGTEVTLARQEWYALYKAAGHVIQ